MTSQLRTMTLYGYETLGDEPTGFCTGLYTVAGKTNELFVPVPTIEGDDTSHVMGFVSVEPESGYERYYGDEITLSVGEDWKDLLLIQGVMHFGTRSELYEVVRPAFKNVFKSHPLTALDLVRSRDDGVRRIAVRLAFNRISEYLGKRPAERWVIEAYFRSQVLTLLRRKMQWSNASPSAIEALRHIQVDTYPKLKTIRFVLPSQGEWNPEDMEPFLRLGDDRYAQELLAEIPSPARFFRLESQFGAGSLKAHYRPLPILVTAIGRGGERHFQDLQLGGGKARFLSDLNWPTRMFEFAKIRDLLSDAYPIGLKDFSFVAVIVDDDVKSDRFRSQIRQLQKILYKKVSIPLLIVPVLPRHRPSTLLRPERQANIFDEREPLILDTTVLRSPGRRRTKGVSPNTPFLDYMTKACILLLTSPETLSRFLSVSSSGKEWRCLRVSQIDGVHYHARFVPSEAVSFRMQPADIAERAFLRDEGGLQREKRPAASALYELTAEKMRRDDFVDLAEAALNDAISTAGTSQIEFRFEEQTSYWPIEMEFPEMAATVKIVLADGQERRVMITAEAPSLKAVRTLEQDDIYLVRYTDRATLKRLIAITAQFAPRRPLPQELAALRPNLGRSLPAVFRRAERADGIVVPLVGWQRWQEEFPHHPLAIRGRKVVPTGIRASNHGNLLVFVSNRDIANFEAAVSGDTGLKELRRSQVPIMGLSRILDDDSFRLTGQGIDQWAIRNNRRPIVPRRLPPDHTVPEGWVVLNGDWYAAAVVASDIFEIWVKGHIASGDAIGTAGTHLKVYNSFPWPIDFSTEGFVTCRNPSPYFTELARELHLRDLGAEYAEPSASELRQEIDLSHRFELGQSLLASYGLERDSSEAEILYRLKFLSDNGDAHSDMTRAF